MHIPWPHACVCDAAGWHRSAPGAAEHTHEHKRCGVSNTHNGRVQHVHQRTSVWQRRDTRSWSVYGNECELWPDSCVFLAPSKCPKPVTFMHHARCHLCNNHHSLINHPSSRNQNSLFSQSPYLLTLTLSSPQVRQCSAHCEQRQQVSSDRSAASSSLSCAPQWAQPPNPTYFFRLRTL